MEGSMGSPVVRFTNRLVFPLPGGPISTQWVTLFEAMAIQDQLETHKSTFHFQTDWVQCCFQLSWKELCTAAYDKLIVPNFQPESSKCCVYCITNIWHLWMINSASSILEAKVSISGKTWKYGLLYQQVQRWHLKAAVKVKLKESLSWGIAIKRVNLAGKRQ